MLVTPTWQGQPWYPRALQKIIQDLILLPKAGKELLTPDSLKHHLMENRTLKLMVWAVSEKNLLQKDIRKRLPHVSQIPVEKAQLIIMTSWRSWNS